jgi:putative transposase
VTLVSGSVISTSYAVLPFSTRRPLTPVDACVFDDHRPFPSERSSGVRARGRHSSYRDAAARPGSPPEPRPSVRRFWLADFVFDRTAEGRVLKCLTTSMTPLRRASPSCARGRSRDSLSHGCWNSSRRAGGLAQVMRADTGPEFCGRALLTWAYKRGVAPVVEWRKPNQNAYIESFNGWVRDECLNEHWFTSPAYARAVSETSRRGYNEERPKRGRGGLTPAAYARTLIKETSTSPPDLKPSATQDGGTSLPPLNKFQQPTTRQYRRELPAISAHLFFGLVRGEAAKTQPTPDALFASGRHRARARRRAPNRQR